MTMAFMTSLLPRISVGFQGCHGKRHMTPQFKYRRHAELIQEDEIETLCTEQFSASTMLRGFL